MAKPEDLKIDDVICDNDPRMSGRKLKIVGFTTGKDKDGITHAGCVHIGASRTLIFQIAIKRIFVDRKVRRSGFNLQH